MTSVSPSLKTGARRVLLLSTACLAAGLLAGCATGIKAKVPALICPATGLVKDTSSLTRFREGASYEPGDVLYEAQIADLASNCTEVNGEVVSNISFQVSGRKGAAFGGTSVSVPYFVVVTTKTGRIVAKQVYNAELAFDSTGRASVTQYIDQRLVLKDLPQAPALPRGQEADTPEGKRGKNAPAQERRTQNFEVLIGLQLSDDDLVYNLSQ